MCYWPATAECDVDCGSQKNGKDDDFWKAARSQSSTISHFPTSIESLGESSRPRSFNRAFA